LAARLWRRAFLANGGWAGWPLATGQAGVPAPADRWRHPRGKRAGFQPATWRRPVSCQAAAAVVVDYRASAPRAHRHDDLKVTGFELADGPQHTGPLVSRELQVYLRASDDLKGIS
jgi:hypothetical protein